MLRKYQSSYISFLKTLFYFMWMNICLHVCLCSTFMPGVHIGQNGTQDPLELELQSVSTIMWVLGTKCISSIRPASAVRHWAISSTPWNSQFLKKEILSDIFTARHHFSILDLLLSQFSIFSTVRENRKPTLLPNDNLLFLKNKKPEGQWSAQFR